MKDTSLNRCPIVYRSCAPVSINGTVPRNGIEECDTADFEEKVELADELSLFVVNKGNYNLPLTRVCSVVTSSFQRSVVGHRAI